MKYLSVSLLRAATSTATTLSFGKSEATLKNDPATLALNTQSGA